MAITGPGIMDNVIRQVKNAYYNAEESLPTPVRNVLGGVRNTAEETFQIGVYSNNIPLQGIQQSNQLDPMLNTIGANADRAAANLTDLQNRLRNAGANPPPGLLAEIQIATSIYNTWMSALTNMAEAKKKAPEEIVRNFRG